MQFSLFILFKNDNIHIKKKTGTYKNNSISAQRLRKSVEGCSPNIKIFLFLGAALIWGAEPHS